MTLKQFIKCDKCGAETPPGEINGHGHISVGLRISEEDSVRFPHTTKKHEFDFIIDLCGPCRVDIGLMLKSKGEHPAPLTPVEILERALRDIVFDAVYKAMNERN